MKVRELRELLDCVEDNYTVEVIGKFNNNFKTEFVLIVSDSEVDIDFDKKKVYLYDKNFLTSNP